MISDGTISGKIAKTVFEEMYKTGRGARSIIEEKGLLQVSDTGELTAVVRKILDENPGEVAKFLAGKSKVMGFFVGQVMKATKGKGNPAVVNQILTEELKSRSLDK